MKQLRRRLNKTKFRNAKLGVPTVLLLVLLASGAVAATVMIYKQVQISMEIVGVWNIMVFNVDKTTELTAIDFGTLNRGDTKRYPASDKYGVKNIGDYPVYISWTKSADWPSDVSVAMYVKRADQATYTVLAEGSVFSTPLEVSSDWMTGGLFWYMEITVSSTAAFGVYNPVLMWNVHDSSTG